MTSSTSTSMRSLALAALLGTSLTEAGSGKSGKDFPSCPKYTGGSSGDSCDKQTLRCGETYHNEKVYLKEDLKCDANETITFKGEKALLDCNGYTIQGYYEDNDDDDNIIVELVDGASIYDCKFLMGYHAIKTLGEGCFTIETVTSLYARNDAIQISNSGTIILDDIIVKFSDDDGIEFAEDYDVDGELYTAMRNIQLIGNHDTGLRILERSEDFKITAELFDEIYIEGSDGENIDVTTFIDVTVYGHVTAIGSAGDEGLELGNDSNFTFAEDSTGVFCYNEESDIKIELLDDGEFEGNFVVEDGATLLCDTGNSGDCTASCNDFPNKAKACVD